MSHYLFTEQPISTVRTPASCMTQTTDTGTVKHLCIVLSMMHYLFTEQHTSTVRTPVSRVQQAADTGTIELYLY